MKDFGGVWDRYFFPLLLLKLFENRFRLFGNDICYLYFKPHKEVFPLFEAATKTTRFEINIIHGSRQTLMIIHMQPTVF